MRYASIPVTKEEKQNIRKQIQSRRSLMVGRISTRKSVHLVELKKELALAEYSKRYHRVMAVYPVMTLDEVYEVVAA